MSSKKPYRLPPKVLIAILLFSAITSAQNGHTSKRFNEASAKPQDGKMLQERHDYFPLSIGNRWTYKYNCDYEYYEGAYLMTTLSDSGVVSFQVTSVSPTDSSPEWSIHENDDIFHREIYPHESAKDTNYHYVRDSQLILREVSDSGHTLICTPHIQIWQFPQLWDDSMHAIVVTGRPVQRFSSDESPRTAMDTIYADCSFGWCPIYFSDTMKFGDGVGLVEEGYGQSEVTMTKTWINWHASLIDYIVDALKGPPAYPAVTALYQNYPNPFNPSTTIRYELPKSSMVRLGVYDILGREVSVLVNERKNAGTYQVTLNGGHLTSGVYFYRLRAGDFVETKRLLILR